MFRKAFLFLLSTLSLFFKVQKSNHQVRWMPLKIKLAITLRYYAGASMYDIADNFGYDVSTCHCVKRQVIKVILECGIGRCVFQPHDNAFLQSKSLFFQGLQRTNSFANQYVGCLDGIAIEIERPHSEFSLVVYQNRKEFYTIVCQAICDTEHRFMVFDVQSPSSVYDLLAFSQIDIFPIL
jgi:hypothetical protein